jgi:hypothetical protein
MEWVACTRFSPDQLDGKSVAWFTGETRHNGHFVVDRRRPGDGKIVLVVRGYAPDTENQTNGIQPIGQVEELLDQATVDRIEDAKPFWRLRGSDFVIFENSPESRELYVGKNQ